MNITTNLKLKLIADNLALSSWCLVPTILCGTHDWNGGGGWIYLYWIKARLGFMWRRSPSA